jgi:Cellulose synthase subunit D
MLDLEQGSLAYFTNRPSSPQWSGFLRAFAQELTAQMPAAESRAFCRLLGQRWARENPLPEATRLGDLETVVNQWLAARDWGWVSIRDLQSSLEFQHSCSPLRQAFGTEGWAWSVGLLEGLYTQWARQFGAGDGLVVRQVGSVEGVVDTLRLRLAPQAHFSINAR